MRAFASAMLILSPAMLVAAATDINGKWTTEIHMESADGRSYTNRSTFMLKNEGGELTGTVESNGRTAAISDGKVEGNKFTFRVVFEGNKGTRTITYEGTVEGDLLKGKLKVRGIGQEWPFEAKRAG